MEKGPQYGLRNRYLDLLSNVVDRADEVKRFVNFLKDKANWAEAPISRKGKIKLIEHSVCVTEVLLKMAAAVNSSIPKESLVICGLFHDISKLGIFIGDVFYPRFIAKDVGSAGNVRVYNPIIAEVALGARTLYMVSKFISLNEMEIQALVGVEGLYSAVNEYMKYKETPLTLLLSWADYWVSHVDEKPDAWEFDKEPWKVET